MKYVNKSTFVCCYLCTIMHLQQAGLRLFLAEVMVLNKDRLVATHFITDHKKIMCEYQICLCLVSRYSCKCVYFSIPVHSPGKILHILSSNHPYKTANHPFQNTNLTVMHHKLNICNKKYSNITQIQLCCTKNFSIIMYNLKFVMSLSNCISIILLQVCL